jgi:3-oxo-5-alpha-steroid 4-dehydrogenase 1
MEIVSPVNLLYILWKLPQKLNIPSLPLSNKLVASLYVIHYINRAIISPFFAAPSMSPLHASVVALAVLFNWLNSSALAGWLVGYHVPVLGYKTDGAAGVGGSYSPATHFLPCLGMVLFAAGMIGNIYSERTLFRLRREAAEKRDAAKESDEDVTVTRNEDGDGDHPTFIQESSSSTGANGKKDKYAKVYVIPPPRGVFRSILYPHYAFEWLEWLGFALVGTAVFPARQALMAGAAAYIAPPLRIAPWLWPAAALAEKLHVPLPLPAVVFFVNAVANMLPHARWGRKWYVEKFGEKAVAGRGAAVPWCSWL